jgi:uncharacterized LabA/DUF88 family protein|tara:strand:- start:24 stop:650 length:627 start_codon:yes stop_codon:yes gene_type:complete
MEDTLVFIDAGFLSKLSKHFGKGKYLVYDLINFSKSISKKQNLSCKEIFYYTAPPFVPNKPSEKEIKMKKAYDDFISRLSKHKNFHIREGRCQRLKINNKFEYKQKGVDSLVVMDLMTVPIDYSKIKKIILIASDSDFVPVIDNLKKRNIKIILYTYYEKGRKAKFSTSNELIKSVDKYVLLSKKDFENAPLEKYKNKRNNIKQDANS